MRVNGSLGTATLALTLVLLVGCGGAGSGPKIPDGKWDLVDADGATDRLEALITVNARGGLGGFIENKSSSSGFLAPPRGGNSRAILFDLQGPTWADVQWGNGTLTFSAPRGTIVLAEAGERSLTLKMGERIERYVPSTAYSPHGVDAKEWAGLGSMALDGLRSDERELFATDSKAWSEKSAEQSWVVRSGMEEFRSEETRNGVVRALEAGVFRSVQWSPTGASLTAEHGITTGSFMSGTKEGIYLLIWELGDDSTPLRVVGVIMLER